LQRPLPHNTQHSQKADFLASVGFEPTISVGERPQTYALDRAATWTGATTGYDDDYDDDNNNNNSNNNNNNNHNNTNNNNNNNNK
jgi:hypothetical protein